MQSTDPEDSAERIQTTNYNFKKESNRVDSFQSINSKLLYHN